ncbi:uncharacterized protein LOC112015299 isoform X1 [Quercus suber]|uniref:uncharacterized protein LOC112015299 isoform X1 n=1 Tax=Quercus suber TaxID=58331 RepID=UPI000CE1A75B|nr:uncharacterized protein LOC112015299 isoform X1 [Quercus suber]POE46408.1 hypothetical protein CFP56_56730 [Quercus suber]
MKPSPLFLPKPITIIRTQPLFFAQTPKFTSNVKPTIFQSSPHRIRLCSVSMSTRSVHSSSPVIESDVQRSDSYPSFVNSTEEHIEKAIYGCRFMTFLGVLGSLVGSFLCFIKGCTHVVSSFMEYFVNRGKVILLLVQAIDVYLLGTVMLVFGMGLYELFVSNLDSSKSLSEEKTPYRSNLFGLFTLKERPKWLDIKTVNELKTKLGHVIVMILLIGLFDKSKKAVIHSPFDLLCFSASVLLSSGSLFLLSKLNGSN